MIIGQTAVPAARKWIRWLIPAMISFVPQLLFSQIQQQLKWNELPSIPDKEGFAGMFAGVSDGHLICMGGANFPDQMPWEGGQKVWYDNIFVLSKNDSSWKIANKKLPRPLAYGVSVTYRNKIILVGGNNAKGYYSDVYSIEYNKGEIQIETLPALPHPVANMTGALVGSTIFIAGGDTSFAGTPINAFWALNLLENPARQRWIILGPWPGPPRIQAVSASLQGNYYMFSGINLVKESTDKHRRVILRDAYKFIPTFSGTALTGGEWFSLSAMPRGVAAGPNPAPTFESNYILFPGGLDSATAAYADPARFPGFVTDLPGYNTVTDSWSYFGKLPEQSARVTLPAAKWNRQWVLPNGEIGPGKRSPKVFTLGKKSQHDALQHLYAYNGNTYTTETPDAIKPSLQILHRQNATLLVANKHSNTLSYINPNTFELIESIPTGPNPHEIVVTPDQKIAYLSSYEPPGNMISVIDLLSRKQTKTISTGQFGRIHGAAISPDGRYAYFTAGQSGYVVEVDTQTNEISRTIPTHGKISHMVYVSPDGQYLLTANIVSEDISVINRSTGKLFKMIPAGKGVEGMSFTPDRHFLWALNQTAGTITIIDMQTLEPTETFDCPGMPVRIRFTSDGRMALVAGWTKDGTLTVIDVATRKEIKRIRVGDYAIGVELTPDEKYAFVGCEDSLAPEILPDGSERIKEHEEDSDGIHVIDLETLEVVAIIKTGLGPDPMTMWYPPFKQLDIK